jgi:hypothetical protein
MGDFADATGRHKTTEKKNHAGAAVFGVLNPSAHVRFFTADENGDILARIGIDHRQTVGNYVGERYSSDVLAGVINHPSNPFGFDDAVLPYTPTLEDRLDCQTVVGLWDLVLDTAVKLAPPAATPVPPIVPQPPVTPPAPPAPDPQLAKLLKLKQRVGEIAAMADGVNLRPNGGGLPTNMLRTVREQLHKALEAAGS